MHYYEVAPRKVIRADAETFTFHSDQALSIGSVVLVSVGKLPVTGVVMQAVKRPSYQTKPIETVLETTPLPQPLITSIKWLSSYYRTALGTVLQTALPTGLQKKRRNSYQAPAAAVRSRTSIVFNTDQQQALKQIESTPNGLVLLHGVTGSGKTAIYIEAALNALAAGKSAIILVPEISLTGQLVAEFSAYFEDVIVTHSHQSEAERHLAWREALNSQQPRVVVGPRSALFMPLASIGLIVIDEAHEPSFKQEQAPRYASTQLASTLAKAHGARLLLGSATPSVADYYLAQQRQRPIIRLPKPALAQTPPSVTLVDMTKRPNFSRHRFLSNQLLDAIETSLASQRQVLIFHNRRGSAASTLCENCGWQAICPNCQVPLILHTDAFHLRCHICGHTESVPTSCPQCSHTNIIHKGIGTKLIEAELSRLFPDTAIARFDGDNANHESLNVRYQEVYDGKIPIIVGTQSIAKGLDLPNLDLVGVIQADAGLSLPDFAAGERTFQLLAQVIGRVGRTERPTSVIVQSYQPTHPTVSQGIRQDYAQFYERTLAERRQALFPPFTYLLRITCSYKTEAAAIRNIKNLAATLKQHDSSVSLFGPAPAFYERARDTYRWQIVLKSPRRAALLDLIKHIPSKNFSYELDPLSLL